MTTHQTSTGDRTTGLPGSGGDVARRTWGLVLVAGLIAGVGSWLAGEGVLRAYRPSLMPRMKPIPTMEDAQMLLDARVASGTAALGIQGGLLGLALGMAGGGSRRSARSAAIAGGLGLAIGTVGVAGMARLILPAFYTALDPQSSDLLYPMLGHLAIWSVAGGSGGLSFGLGAGGHPRRWKVALGGLVGAAMATVAYEFAGALLFPTHRTHLPVSGSPETRAMAQVLVAIGTAIGLVMATAEPKGRRASP